MRREIAYNDLDQAAGVDAEESIFVLRLQANEDAAYDELVRTYHSSIYYVAYRMLGDSADASDVCQDIFLKVFRNIGGFRDEAALKTWIFRIAFSEILNRIRWWRRWHRFSTVSLDDQPNGWSNGHNIADSNPTPEAKSWNPENKKLPFSWLFRSFQAIIVRSSYFAISKASLMLKSLT